MSKPLDGYLEFGFDALLAHFVSEQSTGCANMPYLGVKGGFRLLVPTVGPRRMRLVHDALSGGCGAYAAQWPLSSLRHRHTVAL